MTQPYGNYQLEIYFQGLTGVVPSLPMSFAELEARAAQALSPSIWSYVAGGAGDERTQRANVTAFEQWGLIPRMLVGATERDLSVELWGRRWPAPVFMAPIGVIGLCTIDRHGDLAAARAAAATGVPMCVSTLTMDPLEDVAAQFGDTPGLFQLYTPVDREMAESFVHRAEAAGYAGIVVTLDTWVPGWRPRDLSTVELPSAARNVPVQLHQRPGVPRQGRRRYRRRPAQCRAALGQQFRKLVDLERLTVAAVADVTAVDPQGHLPSRRCPPRDRRRRRRHLLLQPRWAPSQRRASRARLPARRGGRRR